MWPAEGSVCQAMIPLLAQHGIKWIATDEGILSQSTQGFVSRDGQGLVRNPELLYRPYKVHEGEHELGIVFRDHALSDMIGFHYQRSQGKDAADDFMGHLHGIQQAVNHDQPALVSVILDGENCWEHYPEGGVAFLRALYERCTHTPEVRSVKLGEYLEKNSPRDALPRLFAGSWINHNFAIWVGHDEDNTAWDALHRAREHLRGRTQQGHVPAEKIRRAWEEIYIAEGSDWFWWYGDEHSSSQDALFDFLFRKHVQNVYLILGDPPPADLSRPISRRGQKAIHTFPLQFLEVKVDGRETFFEWMSAGRYVCQNERGTMAMVTQGPIKELRFGFNLQALLVRIDLDGPAQVILPKFEALRVGFVEPAGWEVVVEQPAGPRQQTRLLQQGETRPADKIEVGIDRIVELSIPFAVLGTKVDQPLQFHVELLAAKQSRDRAPREGTINLTCPSPDFEQIMWDV
jgi:alpha-amylase/alpha-mannosidase (GH57 family)